MFGVMGTYALAELALNFAIALMCLSKCGGQTFEAYLKTGRMYVMNVCLKVRVLHDVKPLNFTPAQAHILYEFCNK